MYSVSLLHPHLFSWQELAQQCTRLLDELCLKKWNNHMQKDTGNCFRVKRTYLQTKKGRHWTGVQTEINS
jgi:hypothetical protein